MYIEVHGKKVVNLKFTFDCHYLFVEPRKPYIESSNFNENELQKFGVPLRLSCIITGIPEPDISWFKNGQLIVNNESDSRIFIHDDKTTLDIKFIQLEDEGEFKCLGENRLGSVEKLTNLKIQSNT